MNKRVEGLLSVHAAVLLFGITALFSKWIALSAIDITFLRTIPAAVAIALYMKYFSESFALQTWRDYWIALAISILLSSHWITYFYAMQVSTIATGVIALYTYPVITVFLEPLFHGEKPRTKDIASAIVVLFGVYLLVPDLSYSSSQAIGVFWGIISALLFALRNIIQRRYFSHYSARTTQFYLVLFIACLLFPFSASSGLSITGFQWLQIAILGILFTALPHTLYTNSLRYLKAKTVGLIGCMQVVYATIFAALLLSELPDWKTIVGGLLVISGAAYESYYGNKS